MFFVFALFFDCFFWIVLFLDCFVFWIVLFLVCFGVVCFWIVLFFCCFCRNAVVFQDIFFFMIRSPICGSTERDRNAVCCQAKSCRILRITLISEISRDFRRSCRIFAFASRLNSFFCSDPKEPFRTDKGGDFRMIRKIYKANKADPVTDIYQKKDSETHIRNPFPFMKQK